MEYFICTEVKLKCRVCDTVYNLQVKDRKPIDLFKVRCDCHTNVTNDDEINEYGVYEKG